MKKTYTVSIMLFALTIGFIADFALATYEVKSKSQETALYLIKSLDGILENIESKLNTSQDSPNPCSRENRLTLEEMVFTSSLIKEISFIENGKISCSVPKNESNQTLSTKHLKHMQGDEKYALYHANNQNRHVEGVYFMLPKNNGGLRILLDSWAATEMNAQNSLKSCLLLHQNQSLYNCKLLFNDSLLFTTTYRSDKYPYTVVSGYSSDIWFQHMLVQIPFATLIILTLSGLIVLLSRLLSSKRHSLLPDIQRGIDNNEFYAYYQPIVCSKTGCWKGAELLTRWLHPKGNILFPADFIPAAEQSGLIKDITLQLLKRAAHEKKITSAISPNSYISVNVTASMIANLEYIDSLVELINQYPSLQSNLVFEFTEREPFLNSDLILLQTGMEKLRKVGVRWALDDFGTGYAGLSTLQTLHFDILKIDSIFVAASLTNPITNNMLRNIASDAEHAGWLIVAEGVETAEQAKHIADLGLHLSQGYYFDKPMPFDEYVSKMKRLHSPSQIPVSEPDEALGLQQ